MVATSLASGREEVRGRGARAAAVVGVDVGQVLPGARPAIEDGRDPGLGQRPGQRVVAVERDEDDAVHVALADVALDLHVLALTPGQEQEELKLGVRDGGRDPLHDRGEERVGENPALGLGDHERDRVGAPRDEAAGGAVRDVAQTLDRLLDGLAGVGADLRRAVDDTGDGRRRDVRQAGDLLESRRWPAGLPGQIRRSRCLYIRDTLCIVSASTDASAYTTSVRARRPSPRGSSAEF